MRTGEIEAISAGRLRENFGAAASLSFAVLVLYLWILFTGNFAGEAANAVLQYYSVHLGFKINGTVQIILEILLFIILLLPFRIGIKGWYLSLRGEYQSPKSAFSYLKGRKFLRTIGYCTVKQVTVFAIFFVPLLPSIVIAAALKAMLEISEPGQNILFGVLLVLFILLTLVGIYFGIYCCLGLFFADYLYLRQIAVTPIRAIRLSFRMSYGERWKLFFFIIYQLPYFLLYLLGAIPIAEPKVQSAFAAYADDRIDTFTGGTTCQF